MNFEKVSPTFSSFNKCPSLPSVATDSRKHSQHQALVLNNKTLSLFLDFTYRKKVLSF